MTLPALHSVEEVAAALGATPRKVRDWTRRHGWPHILIGREMRFTEEHVLEILARHTVVRGGADPGGTVFIAGQTQRSAAYRGRVGR